MIRRPPRSTLFPYTDALPISDRFLRCGQFGVPGDVQRNGHRLGDRGIGEALLTRLVSGVSRGEADRKSTRLNSSHGYISYAVFCLKKKIFERLVSFRVPVM